MLVTQAWHNELRELIELSELKLLLETKHELWKKKHVQAEHASLSMLQSMTGQETAMETLEGYSDHHHSDFWTTEPSLPNPSLENSEEKIHKKHY